MKKLLSIIVCIVLCASFYTAYASDFETDTLPIGTSTTNSTTNPTTEPTTECTHTWDSGKVVKKATTSDNGQILYTCTKCAKTKTSTIYKIASVKLSSTTYTYNGKVKSPSIIVKNSKGDTINKKYYTVETPSGRKNVGKYTYKVKFNTRYSATKSLTITIKPTATSISSITKASKKITVKWAKKSNQVTGYQIRYATNSSFKNAKTATIKSYKTTSKTISSLKSKQKYYVQVRTYKTVNNTNYYSSWSSTKSVTTK